MPKATHQADRLDAERQHAPQPPARVVEERYRLQPADLPPAGLGGEVTRVTRQGVEAITPVLHLRGAPKPLLLDGENMRRMSAVAGSPLHADWVGASVALRSMTEDGHQVIRIFAVDADTAEAPAAARRPAGSQWRAALFLLLELLLAFGAVYLVENWSLVAGLLPQ
jgi:hypothetical protein